MKTLNEIEAELKPNALAFYSVRCCWWTTDPNDLGELPTPEGSAGSGLPCCPYCGSVLMQAPAMEFIASARASPGHYGVGGLATFAYAHHSSALHALKWNTILPEPVRFPRADRERSTEKSMRCTRCGGEFSEAETEGHSGCPACGATGVPMAIADDVTIRVNWHELRILGIWADNYAQACDRREPDKDCRGAVGGIVHRLQAQYPERTPLTLLGEIRQLQETYPEAELRDSDGKVLLPGKKPS